VRFFLPGLFFFPGFLRLPGDFFLPGLALFPGRSFLSGRSLFGIAHRTCAAKLHTLDRTSNRVPAGQAIGAPAVTPAALHCTYPKHPAVGTYPVFPRGQSYDPSIVRPVVDGSSSAEEDSLLSFFLAGGFLLV